MLFHKTSAKSLGAAPSDQDAHGYRMPANTYTSSQESTSICNLFGVDTVGGLVLPHQLWLSLGQQRSRRRSLGG
jgi:hypothetical protein